MTAKSLGGWTAVTVLLLALTGCPTVELGPDPPDPGQCRPPRQFFEEVIWPDVIAQADASRSCVAESGCHDRDNGRSALRLISDEPLSLTDFTLNYEAVTRFLNCGTPTASPFLTKPVSNGEEHGGGDIFAPGDTEEMLIIEWLGM